MLLYLFCWVEARTRVSFGAKVVGFVADECGRHSQVGSLSGEAHLLNDKKVS